MFFRVLSGVQPTGVFHIGNYLGAVMQWKKMQDGYDPFFFIADQHAITVHPDPAYLRKASLMTLAIYIASGIDLDKNTLFIQSMVPEHAALSWILGCHTKIGWLNRMTQYKEKKDNFSENLGLFSYPVLMAADILLYDAKFVPVGEDQKQHIELARDIAISFNSMYGDNIFVVPEVIHNNSALRIMSLRDGNKKMSKSDDSDYTRINIIDSDDEIIKKINKAKTDSFGMPEDIDNLRFRPEIKNLMTIYAAISENKLEDVVNTYKDKTNSVFKQDLAKLCIDTISPIRKKIEQLMENEDKLFEYATIGAKKAKAVASETYSRVAKKIGIFFKT